jgi:DNA-binding NtrC family response regulator
MAERKCILVVDDDEQVLFFLKEALQALGPWCEVHIARSGLEAADMIAENPFALVITDLRMPGIDGMELTETIRKTSRETTVIWITAFRSRETDLAAEQLAVYCCLEKPVRAAQMRRIVPKALGLDRHGHAEATSSVI